MARNFGGMVDEVRIELDRGAAFDDAIAQAIRRVIHLERATKLGFNELRRPLSVATEHVILDADVLEVTRVRLDSGDNYEPLIEKPANWIHDLRRNKTYTSEPTYYATERNGSARELRFYPAPDTTYSCEMSVLVDLAESVSWTNNLELAWFNEGYLMLLYGALAKVYAVHIGGEEGMAEGQKYSALFNQAKKQVVGEARMFQHSDSIMPCM